MRRLALKLFVAVTVSGSALGQTPVPAAKPPARITDSLSVQRARNLTVTSRGKKAFYTRQFDLSALPHYSPQEKIEGTIHLRGSNYFTDSNLAEYWTAAFKTFQPGITLDWDMKTAAAAIPTLLAGTADIAVSRKITFKELLAFQRTFSHDPLEIVGCTGSYNVPGWSNALVFVVNKSNPLTHLSLQQLDGIYGAERSGGWTGTEWHPVFARGPEGNIRTWGELGLTGDWANKPIHLNGLNFQYQQATDLSAWLLKGSDKWNEKIKLWANYARPDGTLAIAASEMIQAVDKDPYGIAYGSASYITPNTKILAISTAPGGPPVMPTLETVQDRTYPLHDEIYFYINQEPGKPLPPKVREFMLFVLSQEGQSLLMKDGKYLPLPAPVLKQQRDALEKGVATPGGPSLN